ncbi:MAG TPA: CehA/McbA family metallohydrolase, partial [Planctomycetota bacterium]|nr:CehA/McbA family metallohydrolase [Planctomycetota bacterium]
PGATGSKNWPTWTTPVLRWAKKQGGVTGYAHSASGLQVSAEAAAQRLLDQLDVDRDGTLSKEEAARGLLPFDFSAADRDGDGVLSLRELVQAVDRAAEQLPNLVIPEMDSVGAMEIFVTAPQGLCDFISAMDTARLAEWNAWYHLLNSGLPVKVSGETDFPCMSGTRVGQGRVYVKLGKIASLDYAAWCRGIAEGRSYVSDGYAHALAFTVSGKEPGEVVTLGAPEELKVEATVAFSPETPLETPYGRTVPPQGRRIVGDTVDLHPGPAAAPGKRLVELIVNGEAIRSAEVPADGREHELSWTVRVDRSSWVALRHFPQFHTNPVPVIVGGRPVRPSRSSALWCIGCIEQLWRMRGKTIAAAERDEAQRTFEGAIQYYRRVALESER